MKYLLLLSWPVLCGLLLPERLSATVNEPFRFELFSGYRNDRIHWHFQEGSEPYSELYRDIQYWENGVVWRGVYRDLAFFARGSYGAFGKGTVFQRYGHSTTSSEPVLFEFETSGGTADALGWVGYAVDLTADRHYHFILTPFLGYSGSWEWLARKNGRPKGIAEFSSRLPGDFHLVWNGFLFGGAIKIEPAAPTVFHFGYCYHLMHNRMHTQIENDINGTDRTQKLKSSSGGHGGQTGWAQFDWIASNRWRFGIGAQIHYFFSGVVPATLEETGTEHRAAKIRLRWVPVSGWIQISRSL